MLKKDPITMVVCPECGSLHKAKGNKTGIKFHMLTKHPKVKHCTYENCDFKSKYQQNIKDHVQRIHLKPFVSNAYGCTDCEKIL